MPASQTWECDIRNLIAYVNVSDRFCSHSCPSLEMITVCQADDLFLECSAKAMVSDDHFVASEHDGGDGLAVGEFE